MILNNLKRYGSSTHVTLLLYVWKNYFDSNFCQIESDLYMGYERVYYNSKYYLKLLKNNKVENSHISFWTYYPNFN